MSISPVLDAEGRLVNFVGVQADVTERVLVQEQRERALLAEQRARAGLVLLDRVSDAVIELDATAAMERLATVLADTIAPWAAVVQLDRSVQVAAAAGAGLEELVGAGRRVGPPVAELVEDDPLRAVCEGARDEVVVDLGVPRRTGTVTSWFAEVVGDRVRGQLRRPAAGRARRGHRRAARRASGPVPEQAPGFPSPEDEDHRKLVRVVARRTGLSLENARLYAREHSLAETLQRSMLPQQSGIPGLDVWTHYAPNVDHAQVGGDWYDVLPISDDVAGLVVGDVVGHDVEAAATMGQLRSVVRSYAYELEDPGSVLMRVDHLAAGMGIARMASLVLMTLRRRDDGQWDLSWSSAGHLPALVGTPRTDPATGAVTGYSVRRLDSAQGTLIGLREGARFSDTVRLRPGDVVVAYTDGLIERRSRPMAEGLEVLVDVLQGATSRLADGIGERLLDALGDSPEDDTAVVVLRVPLDVADVPAPRAAAPRQRRWQLPSDPSSVGKARHATLRACAVWGVTAGRAGRGRRVRARRQRRPARLGDRPAAAVRHRPRPAHRGRGRQPRAAAAGAAPPARRGRARPARGQRGGTLGLVADPVRQARLGPPAAGRRPPAPRPRPRGGHRPPRRGLGRPAGPQHDLTVPRHRLRSPPVSTPSDPRGPGLLPGPAPTYLPEQLHAPAEQALAAGTPAATVAAAAPAASLAWAVLAEEALAPRRRRPRGRRRARPPVARHRRVRLRPHRLPPRPGRAAPLGLEGPRPRAVVARAEPGLPAQRPRPRRGGRPRRRGRRGRAAGRPAARRRPQPLTAPTR